MIYVHIIRVHY